jgi:hypothetical protein
MRRPAGLELVNARSPEILEQKSEPVKLAKIRRLS